MKWHLKLRTIPKKDLNWYLPRIIFVAMSLIFFLSGLAYYPLWTPGDEFDPVALLLFSFAQIITLGAMWKTLSGIIEFYNLKPNSIYVAMILLFILLSVRTYIYHPMISFNAQGFLAIHLSEILMLGLVWKMLSEIREFNKTKTSIVKTGIARRVDWQWVLIGVSFLLFFLGVVWHLYYRF